ncbi:hypothetical protein [Gynuella sunshinyii]|uniref:Uncharacterized protein n=1 Tax=Gynuella sunshinyii YC6258 TaxID=1445510 RepID=A0A0C5W2L3_9GAMM|nr:hypothetical protein [Gynuella sunshinyii]AJQ96914.1 hypothetical Protein YC6258_04882 [Gynuella sunshinyii YC6258]
MTERYFPRFLVTKAEYDAASSEERSRYNYVVVPDEPISLPNICCAMKTERESAENRTKTRPLNERK